MTIHSDTLKWDILRVGAKNLIFPPYLKPRAGTTVIANLQTWDTYATWFDYGANKLFAVPIILPQKARLNRIGIRIHGAGGAGAKARLGIYRDTGKLYPSDLVVDAGEVDATAVAIPTASINVILKPGVYWLAAVLNDGTIDLARQSAITINADGSSGCGWSVAQTYGPLPSTFPSGASTEQSFKMVYGVAEWL